MLCAAGINQECTNPITQSNQTASQGISMIYVLSSYRPEVLAENAIYPTSPLPNLVDFNKLTLPVRLEFLKACQTQTTEITTCYDSYPSCQDVFFSIHLSCLCHLSDNHIPPAQAWVGGSGKPWAPKCCRTPTGNDPGRNQVWSFTFPSSFQLSFPLFIDFFIILREASYRIH